MVPKIKNNKTFENLCELYGNDSTVKADGFDDCVIGMDTKQRLVYSIPLILKQLELDMNKEEALEFFYFNIEGAHVGKHTPIYINI